MRRERERERDDLLPSFSLIVLHEKVSGKRDPNARVVSPKKNQSCFRIVIRPSFAHESMQKKRKKKRSHRFPIFFLVDPLLLLHAFTFRFRSRSEIISNVQMDFLLRVQNERIRVVERVHLLLPSRNEFLVFFLGKEIVSFRSESDLRRSTRVGSFDRSYETIASFRLFRLCDTFGTRRIGKRKEHEKDGVAGEARSSEEGRVRASSFAFVRFVSFSFASFQD